MIIDIPNVNSTIKSNILFKMSTSTAKQETHCPPDAEWLLFIQNGAQNKLWMRNKIFYVPNIYFQKSFIITYWYKFSYFYITNKFKIRTKWKILNFIRITLFCGHLTLNLTLPQNRMAINNTKKRRRKPPFDFFAIEKFAKWRLRMATKHQSFKEYWGRTKQWSQNPCKKKSF